MGNLLGLLDNPMAMGIVSTAILAVALLVLRAILARAIRDNEKLPKEARRRWLVQVRNLFFLLFVLGIVMIWAEELRLFTVSIFAVAVATVIATKELIQCITGTLLRTGSKSFKINDRIEVAGVRGEVIDHNLLTTTVLEVSSHQLTGRAVVLPNSVFLGKPLINESYTHKYVLHSFKVPIKMDSEWSLAEQDLLTAARQECGNYLEDARHHFTRFAKHEGLVSLGVDPRVTVAMPKAGELELVVRVAVPARRKGRVEQAILRRYLVFTAARVAQKEAEKEAAKAAEKETPAAPEAIPASEARKPRSKPNLSRGTTRWRRSRKAAVSPTRHKHRS